MLGRDAAERLRTAIVSTAGGYLRNPVRQEGVTCAVCATPVDGYRYCFSCKRHRTYAGLADSVAALTYAVRGTQSGYVMRGYKADPPVHEHQLVVRMLALLALSQHGACPGVLQRAPVTHWAAVPSLPAKPGVHPMHPIAASMAPGAEIPLTAAAQAARPRDVDVRHFTAAGPLPPSSHVLVVDDTWTQGGHAQSAALALREAGAAHVSVLAVARWINPGFGDNDTFLRALPDYDPDICPWTAGDCPPVESARRAADHGR